MIHLPKNPKPHFNKGRIGLPKPVKYDREKVLQEMIELIRENKKIVEKYTSPQNETVYE